MEKNIQQAVAFFKSEFAYKQLFTRFRKKYESLGRIGGNVSVNTLTDEELEVIGGLLGMSGDTLRAKGSVSLTHFEQQLHETRFGNIALKELLDAYFGDVIISKKKLRAEKETIFNALLQELSEQYPALDSWLFYLKGKPAEGRWIVRMAMENESRFVELAGNLAEAMVKLPRSAERLPMFSQRITGDPHAFDLHTDLGKMFLHLLTVDLSRDEMNVAVALPKSTEALNELLQSYNIYRDDLLNFVTCAGLYAETNEGTIHPVWSAAVQYGSVQIVPLREMVNLSRVYPVNGKDVWIIENSGVCSTILDHVAEASIICTNGQFKLAALMLMDFLVKEGCILHYAGDFDPEGLGMAQRLLDRYPNNATLWQMDLTAYRKSSPVKQLNSERMEKLNGIVDKDLQLVADEMRKVGKAGYQEALVELMVEDIRRR